MTPRKTSASPRGHQVDRPAHHSHSHSLEALDQPPERLLVEPVEPAPQRVVGIPRLLRLQADQVLERVRHWHLDPLQQELSAE